MSGFILFFPRSCCVCFTTFLLCICALSCIFTNIRKSILFILCFHRLKLWNSGTEFVACRFFFKILISYLSCLQKHSQWILFVQEKMMNYIISSHIFLSMDMYMSWMVFRQLQSIMVLFLSKNGFQGFLCELAVNLIDKHWFFFTRTICIWTGVVYVCLRTWNCFSGRGYSVWFTLRCCF